jgi:hypothetical protein
MTNWLPDEEAARLRSDFEAEMARLIREAWTTGDARHKTVLGTHGIPLRFSETST